jgi:DNA gyrase subunit B
VGASVTNALSEWLEVEVTQNGALWHAAWARGKRTFDLKKGKKASGNGTRVRWKFDREIFKEQALHYDPQLIERRLREKSFLVRGLRFVFQDYEGVEHVFESKDGIAEYISELSAERDPLHKVIFLETESQSVLRTDGEETSMGIETALAWTARADERIYSFANVVTTPDGGTHVTGLRSALTKAINTYGVETGKLKKDKANDRFDARDVFHALTGAVSIKIQEPQFEGQTKGRLNNPEARSAVQSFVYGAFTQWLNDKKNLKDSKEILERCLYARKVRLAQGKVSKQYDPNSIWAAASQSAKLADCAGNATWEEKELYIVEGDSAGGTAKAARNGRTQAILPLRGKPLNVVNSTNAQIFDNEEIQSIITALGGRIDQVDGENIVSLQREARRYNKIIICSVDREEMTFIQGPDEQTQCVKIGCFIDDLIAESKDPTQYKVLCFDQETLKTHFKALKQVIRHPISEPLYELSTAYGRQVRVTSSHSVFTYENQRIVLKEGCKIKEGDVLLAPRKLPLALQNPIERIDLLKALHGSPYSQNLFVRGSSVAQLKQQHTTAGMKKDHPHIQDRIVLFQIARNELKQARKRCNYTLSDMAKICEVQQACSISEWETGRSNPPLKAIHKYCEAVGIESDDLLLHSKPIGSLLERLYSRGDNSENYRLSRSSIRLNQLSSEDLDTLGEDIVITSQAHAKTFANHYLNCDDQLFFLIGLYTAEGSSSPRCGVRFSLGPRDNHLLPEIAKAGKEMFQSPPSLYPAKNSLGYEVRIQSQVAATVFNYLFNFQGSKSSSKRLPDIIFNASPHQQLECLRGVFLGDGSYDPERGRVTFNTTSSELASQLMYLLSVQGVVASRSTIIPVPRNELPSERISVSAKQDLHKIRRVWEDRSDAIGLPEPFSIQIDSLSDGMLAPQIAKGVNCSVSNVRKAMSSGDLVSYSSSGTRGRMASRQAILNWISAKESNHRKYITISDDLIGLPVVKTRQVEPSCDLVYDFSVEGDENFVCGTGGICCHNSDADTDGAHISYLVMGVFHELFPELLREGRLFIARPPLYKINLDARGEKVIYVYPDEDVQQVLKKYKRTGNDLTRFKGLGEMDKEHLAETVMEPETRQLYQITIEEAGEVAEAISLIMGKSAARRKTWLESGAAPIPE